MRHQEAHGFNLVVPENDLEQLVVACALRSFLLDSKTALSCHDNGWFPTGSGRDDYVALCERSGKLYVAIWQRVAGLEFIDPHKTNPLGNGLIIKRIETGRVTCAVPSRYSRQESSLLIDNFF